MRGATKTGRGLPFAHCGTRKTSVGKPWHYYVGTAVHLPGNRSPEISWHGQKHDSEIATIAGGEKPIVQITRSKRKANTVNAAVLRRYRLYKYLLE